MGAKTSWLIVNARSGSATAAAIEATGQALADRGMAVSRALEFPSDDLPNPAGLTDAGVSRLVVFTGDGSLNAVIRAVDGWDGEVLVLPGGTMNLLCHRLHGNDVECGEILDRIASGAFRPVRPQMACCEEGSALAGLLVGPGTAWGGVREAMRDLDVPALAESAGEALNETTAGARVRMAAPAVGHEGGYALIELTPSHRGLQVDGFSYDGPGEFLQQSWAVLRRRFREGPHERLGLLDEVVLENVDGEPLPILIDGEPAILDPRAKFTVAPCPVDLLATHHGF